MPSQPGGASTHKPSPSAVLPKARRSRHTGITSFSPGVTAMVNAGITRPAITHSIITISASPACKGMSGETARTPMTVK